MGKHTTHVLGGRPPLGRSHEEAAAIRRADGAMD